MDLRIINDKQKVSYERLVTHVMQSWAWGEFRKKLGAPLFRYGIYEGNKLKQAFQITIHKIPLTKKTIGYLPKGPLPNKELAEALEIIGRQNNCAFIKLEPDIEAGTSPYSIYPKFLPSPKSYFTKFNLILDLTKSEEEILKNMKPKTRYNIRLAQKKGVVVEERFDEEAFKIYLDLYFETTKRQGFHGHNEDYHKKVWQILKEAKMARLLIAFYTPPGEKERYPASAWMLLNFKDTLYYPYGGSSVRFKEIMANNLVAWESIKLGKRLKLKKFDMWGALGPEAPENHPHFGFYNFKRGFGPEKVEYVGTYDLVFDELLYFAITFIDRFTAVKVYLLRLLGS